VRRSSIPADVFGLTMEGLEQGLRVRHIATFDLATCSVDDETRDVLTDRNTENFDYIPVRDGGRIMGVLARSSSPASGRVAGMMHPLDDTMLVSADEPLASYILSAHENPYRLVVEGTAITGIVTRSDVLKLPVRLLTFAMITHLESLLTTAIQQACPNDEQWLKHLCRDDRRQVRYYYKKYKEQRFDPPLLEFTSLGQKVIIIKGILATARSGMSPPNGSTAERIAVLDDASIEDLDRIWELRNDVAHGRLFVDDPRRFQDFVRLLRAMQSRIHDFREVVDMQQPAGSEAA
jgi:predicted transcriptional regulator